MQDVASASWIKFFSFLYRPKNILIVCTNLEMHQKMMLFCTILASGIQVEKCVDSQLIGSIGGRYIGHARDSNPIEPSTQAKSTMPASLADEDRFEQT